MFPDLKLEYLDERYSNAWNQWDYVHKSYHGGWVYVNPRYAHRIIKMGLVFDVNSLYPSVMHSVSDNYYPVGYGTYKRGKPGEEIINKKDVYYFIRVRCRFKLKENALPWLHIRHNAWYKSNENLYTSDVKYNGKYYLSYSDNHDDGEKHNRMCYAISDSPLGPWEYKGIYMEPTDSYTNHGSIVEFKGQWYSFYHNSALSGHDWLRSICVDKLYYNPDGTIKMVKQTK